MAGGHGTRLWPLSTKTKPKQFQKLLNEQTLFQSAYERINFLDPSDIFVSTNQEFADIVREQLPQVPESNLIIEPLRRDTGPAMAFVTHYLAKQGFTDEVVSIVYADHYIPDQDIANFQEKLKFAQAQTQEHKKISIVQVKAKEPDTTLGYTKIGKLVTQIDNHRVYELAHFVEKPDLETAKRYANSLDYLWNTGLYSWHIGTFLDLLEQHTPEITEILNQIEDHNDCSTTYEKFPKISIDYALMEKLPNSDVLIIPADFEWSDVGNWQRIHAHLKDYTSNVTCGQVHKIDTSNSIIYANSKQKVVTIGIKDLAIICTDDTILVCPKSETTRIKQMVEEMGKTNN